MVVLGHWLAAIVVIEDGRPSGENLVAAVPWTRRATWLFQIMPVFFLVGGYANAASWVSARRRGESGTGWLIRRCRRLLVPTTGFLAVGVPGEELRNTSPPSLALLALAATQTGVVLLLRETGARLCQRPAVWVATVAMNSMILTIYLWHMVPVVIGGMLMSWYTWLPQPAIGTLRWWALRPAWLGFLAVVLAVVLVVIVRLVGPLERRGRPTARSQAQPGQPRPTARTAGATRAAGPAAVAGVLAVCAGLVQITVEGLAGGPAGIPIAGLAPYGIGLLLLSWAGRADPAQLPAATRSCS